MEHVAVALFATAVVLLIGLLVALVIQDIRSHQGRKGSKEERMRDFANRRIVPGVYCPACNQAMAMRYTTGERVLSGLAGGLIFSRAARRTFRCLNCGMFF